MTALLFLLLCLTSCQETETAATCTIDVHAPLTPVSPGINNHSSTAWALIYSYIAIKNDSGCLVPDLAESFTHLKETLSWKITLKKAVFHDGRPVTSRDVADSILRGISHLREISSKVDGVIIADYRTVIFRLYQVDESFIERISYIEITPSGGPETVGSGPYKIDSTTHDKLVLVRNDRFYGLPSRIDRIVLRYIPDRGQSLQRLLSGETDVVHDVNGVEIPDELTNTAEWRRAKISHGINYVLIFNGDSNKARYDVRSSVASALDSHGDHTPIIPPVELDLLLPSDQPYLELVEALKKKLDGLGVRLNGRVNKNGFMDAMLSDDNRKWDAAITELSSPDGKSKDYWLYLVASGKGKPGFYCHPSLALFRASLPLATGRERQNEIFRQMYRVIQDEYLQIDLGPKHEVTVSSKSLSEQVVFTSWGLRRFAANATMSGRR